jgi:hypothetical protein
MIWNNYYLFLFAAAIFIAIGLYFFFHQGTQVSHFNGIAVQSTSETSLETQLFIEGQYKTVGEGFFVGKEINVSALLYLRDKNLYDYFKSMPEGARVVIVNNSEDPTEARKDISEPIQEGNKDKAFVNPGTLKMVKFYDGNQTIVLNGNVVFTKEGVIEFGQPLGPILQSYNVQIQGMPVEPASTKYEIDLNRTVLLLTFITIAVAFIALFFGLYKKA